MHVLVVFSSNKDQRQRSSTDSWLGIYLPTPTPHTQKQFFYFTVFNETKMKFCENMQMVVQLSDPEWAPFWVDYGMLKVSP
jgi:hypothetical protein